MIHDLYPSNWRARRLECLLRAGGRCENVIDGKRCPRRLGTLRISRAHNLIVESLHVIHVNDDPENPDAELRAYCPACHMRLHRCPGSDGKTPRRKRGYHVVSVHQLLARLATYGRVVSPNETGGVTWHLGLFEAEAVDPIDAIASALHWLTAELQALQPGARAHPEGP